MTYEELIARAKAAPPFAALVDPDDASFLSPGDMPARLAAFCTRTGQAPPQTEGALRSLLPGEPCAQVPLDNRSAGGDPRHHNPDDPRGWRWDQEYLLCQFTADACGRPVHAGPVEATAIGNILMQAIGRKKLGSIADLRSVVARSFPVTIYEPQDTSGWTEAFSSACRHVAGKLTAVSGYQEL